MLNIICSDTFTNEKRYIAHSIFAEFLGVPYTLDFKESLLEADYYKIILGNKTIKFHDCLFNQIPEGEDYLQEQYIPKTVSYQLKKNNSFISEPDIPIIYGSDFLQVTDNEIICGIDIFASIFFMLSRWEEYVNKIRDQHNRFPATASLEYQHNFLLRPVVNEYVEMLWNMLKALGYEGQRKQRKFEIKVSHDVDLAYFYYNFNLYGLFRKSARQLIKNKFPLNAFRVLYHGAKYFLGCQFSDPYDTFDYLMSVSEQHGLCSAFYFITDNTSKLDSNYQLTDPKIKQLLQKIFRRGHEIGLHPSYHTYQNKAQLCKEFDRLRKTCADLGIVQNQYGGRQHFLRWGAAVTPSIWDQAGLNYDSTLGYADYIGFRCGVCYEFPLFDFIERKTLKLVERPLIVMECSLISQRYMGHGFSDKGLEIALNLKDRCKKYHGLFNLLWHNSFFNNDKQAFAYYEKLIR